MIRAYKGLFFSKSVMKIKNLDTFIINTGLKNYYCHTSKTTVLLRKMRSVPCSSDKNCNLRGASLFGEMTGLILLKTFPLFQSSFHDLAFSQPNPQMIFPCIVLYSSYLLNLSENIHK